MCFVKKIFKRTLVALFFTSVCLMSFEVMASDTAAVKTPASDDTKGLFVFRTSADAQTQMMAMVLSTKTIANRANVFRCSCAVQEASFP